MTKKKTHETQTTVNKWCNRHYPGQDAKQRLCDLFEEATELAASLNVATLDELTAVVTKSWEKSKADIGDRTQTAGEIGDVRIATAWLASSLHISDQQALDRKMTKNRRKTVAQSQARFKRKEKIFSGK